MVYLARYNVRCVHATQSAQVVTVTAYSVTSVGKIGNNNVKPITHDPLSLFNAHLFIHHVLFCRVHSAQRTRTKCRLVIFLYGREQDLVGLAGLRWSVVIDGLLDSTPHRVGGGGGPVPVRVGVRLEVLFVVKPSKVPQD